MEENLRLMRLIDEQYLQRPFFGSRQMTQWLRREGYVINRKRVRRLMRTMGLESIAPRPRTTRSSSAGTQRTAAVGPAVTTHSPSRLKAPVVSDPN